MRRVALALAAVLLVLTAGWAAPRPAYACSCAVATDEQHAAAADVVFTGTADSYQVDERAQTRTVTFTVDQVFKGVATTTQVVTTHSSGASCGLEISGPGPFLVYAVQQQSVLTADLCGGTRAGPAPASLGPGRPPSADPRPGDDRRGMWVPLVALALALSGGTVVALSLVRRRPE